MSLTDACRSLLGNADIALIDAIQRGRIADGARIIDLGCGGGRNLVPFIPYNHQLAACDPNPEAAHAIHALSSDIDFHLGTIANTPWPDNNADCVLCIAVLHFASDAAEAEKWLQQAWRLVKPGGFLFIRLATTIGINPHLPASGFTFRPNYNWLIEQELRLQGERRDPIKTAVIENQRAMTTWILDKPT